MMLPLIALAAKLLPIAAAVPEVVRAFGGDKQAEVASRIIGAAKAITGASTSDEAVDQVLADPAMQLELQRMLASERIEYSRLEVEDRKSARDREIRTGDRTTRNLAYAVTVGFFGILSAVLYRGIPADSQVALLMLGSLGTAWTGIVAYYFGSSLGSKAKDSMLNR
jgi:hypothetical protein